MNNENIYQKLHKFSNAPPFHRKQQMYHMPDLSPRLCKNLPQIQRQTLSPALSFRSTHKLAYPLSFQ